MAGGPLRLAPTFGPAPKRSVVTVERQLAYYEAVMRTDGMI